MTPLEVRVAAAETTHAAYAGRTFVWGADCIRMSAHALRGLGYKPRLSRGGSYKTALGARRALARAGFERIEDALDALGLVRLPWAYALPGDIVALPSAEDWPALGVVMGPGAVLAFSDIDGVCRLAKPKADDVRILWSAPPCRKQR